MAKVYKHRKHVTYSFKDGREFTDKQRDDYGLLCRKSRSMMGLTDGLRLDSGKFNRYIDERRAADAAQRPGGQGIYILDPTSRCILASRW